MNQKLLILECVIKMKNLKTNKSGQMFIISAFILLISLFFIYSQETDNYYILSSGESIILENLIYETCQIGYLSNGSYIETRYSLFQNLTNSNCLNSPNNCTLSIMKIGGAPTNLSLLNYTHFNYNLSFIGNTINYSNSFTC